jgi:hypothetical protein
MMDRLRAILGLDSIVPVVLVAAAVLMTLEPTVLGVTLSERQIVLAFFGFLGIDTLIERTGRLRGIEGRLEALAGKSAGTPAAGRCSARAARSNGWTHSPRRPGGASSSSG